MSKKTIADIAKNLTMYMTTIVNLRSSKVKKFNFVKIQVYIYIKLQKNTKVNVKRE